MIMNQRISIMRVIYFIVTVSLWCWMTACSNGEIVENELTETVPPRTLRLKASMPDEGTKDGSVTTRVLLSEAEEGNITVQWKEGDQINLCFVSEGGSTVRTVLGVPVTHISPNGKSADFEITIPAEITGTFNLYGVYGASFSPVNSSTLLLPGPHAGTALSDNEAVSVMRFAAENLTEASSPQVSFSHLGSIFAVWIYNDTASPVNVGQLTLSSAGKGYNWLRNSSGQATFNIAANSFINAYAGTELVYSPPSGTTIAAGGSLKLYRWVVPGNEIDPSDQSKLMDIKDINGSTISETIFARAMQAGKYYRLKMVYDGTRFRYIKIPTDSNLVGYWPFDGNANDMAGTNHGTLNGNVTLTTDRKGNANSAYQFNGSSGDYIKCVSPGITGTGARTFSFWAMGDALSASEDQTILAYGGPTTASGSRFEIALNAGKLICDISISNLKKSSALITNDQWNFYTIVFAGGTGKNLLNNVRFYVNGGFLSSVTDSNHTEVAINTSTGNTIYFGTLYNTQRWFKGAIDEVRMYDRALTGAEVKGLYYRDRSY